MSTLVSVENVTPELASADVSYGLSKRRSSDGNSAQHSHSNADGISIRSNTFDAVRAAGLAVFRPSRIPTGFELQEVIQSSSVTSYFRYSDVANKRNISIAVAPGARLKVLENSWEATTVQGKTAYIIRGNWRTSSSNRAVSLSWESSGQVLLAFEHSGRAVVLSTDSPDHVTVTTLKDIVESFTLET